MIIFICFEKCELSLVCTPVILGDFVITKNARDDVCGNYFQSLILAFMQMHIWEQKILCIYIGNIIIPPVGLLMECLIT